MHKRTARVSVFAAAAAALTIAVTGCGSDSEPDEAACKEAIAEAFKAEEKGDENALEERPDACEGIDEKTAQRLGTEVAEDMMEDVQ
jgi:hypothetical protein